MRIATWNLEGRSSAEVQRAQREVLTGVEADVTVLTEVAATWEAPAGQTLVGSVPPEDDDKRWVVIAGPGLTEIDLGRSRHEFEAAALATVEGREVVVYGSVLPWTSAPGHVPHLHNGHESSEEMFDRILHLQKSRLEQFRAKHSDAIVIWAGDFNQTLEGPNWGGSAHRRDRLENTLARLDLQAWNRTLAHAKSGMCAIDLICGPPGLCTHISRLDPAHEAGLLSDHAGYVAEIDFERERTDG